MSSQKQSDSEKRVVSIRQCFDAIDTGTTSSNPNLPTPEDVLTMVDQVLYAFGQDPQNNTDSEGWRYLRVGTVYSLINVLEWKPDFYVLIVWTPMLRTPKDPRLRGWLFEYLLKLNHSQTGMARFSLKDDSTSGPNNANNVVVLSFVRPIYGLDFQAVLEAIRLVMLAADFLDEPLQNAFEVAMPQINLTSEVWQGVLNLMRLCDTHTQMIFNHILEEWVRCKGKIQIGDKYTIALSSITSEGKVLATLCPTQCPDAQELAQLPSAFHPMILIKRDRLIQNGSMQPKDLAAFIKRLLSSYEEVKVEDTAICVPVDEVFTVEMADQLVDALVELDKALGHALTPGPEPLPDLKANWGLSIEVSDATQRSIHALLGACPSYVAEIYELLIQGWYNAGEKMYSTKSDRLYLRLSVRDHTFALATLYGAQHRHGARIELRYPLTYYLDAYLGARRRYEQVIGRIPGFRVHNTGARIPIKKTFEKDEAERLLKAMCRLAEDVSIEMEST